MAPPPVTRGRRAESVSEAVSEAAAAPIAIETVEAGSITADHFWRTFVSKRRPALIRGLLHADPAFRGLGRWKDDAHLVACAGNEDVEVERGAVREVAAAAGAAASAALAFAASAGPPASSSQAKQRRVVFGLGDRTRMTLREFLERKARGEPLYLSTQTHPRAPEDGAPDLYGPPLRRTPLCGEAPLVPSLLSPLVPQAVNVWMSSAAGAATDGPSSLSSSTTSGLHHDYHDNLYMLLRGRKRFRLWPPSAAAGLYPHGGPPAAVHASGRIVYGAEGGGGSPPPCTVLPDGTDAAEAARWRRRWDAERAVAAAEGRARRREPGARQALRVAEAALEAALEADLEDELLGARGRRSKRRGGGGKEGGVGGREGGGGGEDEEEVEEDSDEGEGGLELFEGMRDDYDELCGGDDDEGGGGGGGGGPDDEEDDEEDDAKEDDEEQGGKDGPSPASPPAPPPSFSRIDLSPYPVDDDASPEAVRRADAELRARFPLFPGLASALSARMEEGDALFLPAGWFHEVTTYGAEGGSFALNYWFYPPDALDEAPPPLGEEGGVVGASPLSPSASSPPSPLRLRPLWPYRASGGFLPELWRRRLDWLAPRHAAMRALADAIASKEAAGGGASARAQRLERLRKMQQQQQQQQAAKTPEGGGGRSPLLRFHAGVSAPDNRYRTSTTRPGSASGAPSAPPKLSAERRDRLGLPPPPPEEEEEEDDEDEEEEEDDGDDGDDDEEEEAGIGMMGPGADGDGDGEASGQAAFRAMLKANPDLARQLLARLAQQQQQQQGRGGGGAGAVRRPTRAERQWMARREVWLAHGRRHHLVAGRWRGRDWGWGGRRRPGEGCETRGEVVRPPAAAAAAGAAEKTKRPNANGGDDVGGGGGDRPRKKK